MEQFLTIRNGAKAMPTFPHSETVRRLAMLRRHMAAEDLEAVLFTSIHNITYFSDFIYCAFGRPYGLLVTHERAVTISAKIDGGHPYRRSVTDNLIYTDWKQDNFFRAVHREIATAKRVGVEFDHLSLVNHRKLAEALGEAEFLDIGAATMRMRMIKSEAEIALICQGATIADIGGANCVEALGEGVPEYEVVLHATGAMVREIARRFPDADLMDTWTWFQSGLNTDGAHNPVTSRRIRKGDILSLNCFPMISGYYTALERTLFLDHASDRHLALWEINCKVHRRGLELIKPGVRCCDIARELNEIYRDHDLLQYRTFGYGHSFGILSHYYGREAGLELREDIETVLEPGMVISMEPMIMIPEGMAGAGGYREHDILVVRDDGADNITGFPLGPEHNIVPV